MTTIAFKTSKAAHTHKNAGFLLVEALIGIGITAVLLATFTTLTLQATRYARASTTDLAAMLAGRETVEAVTALSRTDWDALSNSNCADPLSCHVEVSAGAWVLKVNDGSENAYRVTRVVSFKPVYRDSGTFPNKIVDAVTAFPDENTKKAVVSVSWHNGTIGRTVELETYVYKMP